MTKRYNTERFSCTLSNGYTFHATAWTTNTRNGFCHTVQAWTRDPEGNYFEPTKTKVSYLNRTWERFRYETALLNAIGKFPQEQAKEIRAILIGKTAKDAADKGDKIFEDFKKQYNQLTDSEKEKLKGITLTSMEQAEQLTAVMKVANLFKVIGGRNDGNK